MLLVNHYCNTDIVTRVIVLLLWFLSIPLNSAADSLPGLNVDVLSTLKSITPSDSSKGSHDPCQVCRNLVKSFERGLRLTSRGKFEGGDADWEESRLGSYQDSEVRLIEIQEKLCDDVSSGKDACHQLAEESEALIESYWFNDKKTGVSLDDFLCIQSKGLCCHWNHFGPDCASCSTCNFHGQCIGNGSRSGSGGCSCDTGYSGESCTECQSGFYVNQSDPVICESCDKSCAGTCRFAGSKGCQVCRDGYIWDEEYGCIDVDECIELGYNPCRRNSFCVNTQGSYQCFKCDKSCNGCNGDGPDMCLECEEGFVKKDDICVDSRSRQQEQTVDVSRYATYFGLCVATCVIFSNNIYLASIIGVMVALYIAVAEYTIDHRTPLLSPIEQAFRSALTSA